MKKLVIASISALLFTSNINAATLNAATLGFADVVLDFYDSGAGPLSGPYGGTGSSFPISVSTDVVLGNNNSFLSLATGSYVTVGFTDETIIDGIGNDLFIEEIGAASETADIFISSNLTNYIFLGTAFGNGITSFDLASIGFTGAVQSVKIIGLDNFGSSPGFDVVSVQALVGSIGDAPSPVPVPAAIWLFASGLIGLLGIARKKSGNHSA